MNIRPYQTNDEEAVIQLWTDCELVVPHNNPLWDIEQKLKVDPELFLVGEYNGKVIASCMVGYEGHRGWINYLAVSPEHQCKGYAREMMITAEQKLRKLGCPKINLQVRSTNAKVIEFYKRIGFTEDDVVSLGKRLETD